MASTFRLVISSVGETKYDGPAISATIPGTDGEFTVLPHHEPFVTTLKEGTIKVRRENGSEEFAVQSGILECSGTQAVVLL